MNDCDVHEALGKTSSALFVTNYATYDEYVHVVYISANVFDLCIQNNSKRNNNVTLCLYCLHCLLCIDGLHSFFLDLKNNFVIISKYWHISYRYKYKSTKIFTFDSNNMILL